LGRGRI